MWRIGIDTGGTFTDLIAVRADRVHAIKVLSTPRNPADAVLHALQELEQRFPDVAAEPWTIVHGSTVATNALLERKAARVVFVTNEGFEDLIEIGRQNRRDLYALHPSKATPPVAREDRLGISERTLADGRRHKVPTARELRQLVQRVRSKRPPSIAIGLLHAYANPAAEKELEAALSSLRVPVSRSSAVAPLFREYERFSTTIVNAALLPVVQRYLSDLQKRVRTCEVLIMQSNGGLTSAADAARHPVRMVLSGPAGGLAAAEHRLRRSHVPCAVTFDMGGTSTDVGLVHAQARTCEQLSIQDLPLLVNSLDIQTIGAGGGSILWIDEAGALRVGPQSAGADPGPACYGRGTLPCITDAHAALGRLPTIQKLGGVIEVDVQRSVKALERLARTLRTNVLSLACAALEVADAAMEKAVRSISLERGFDPRTLTLFAFGGAGGLHACRLAARLRMREVFVPPYPGATSAFGMAVSSARIDVARGWIAVLDSSTQRPLTRQVQVLCREARTRLLRELGPGDVLTQASIACRYVGQSFEILVPWGPRLSHRFAELHEQRFGFRLDQAPLQCVAIHASAMRRGPTMRSSRKSVRRRSSAPAERGATDVWLSIPKLRRKSVPMYDRERLRPGMEIPGPALILESTATTFVEREFNLRVDAADSLRITGRA